MTNATPREGELILYRTADDAVRVEVLYESETFWLDQRRMAELFGVDRTVNEHLRNIHDTGKLSEATTLRKIRRDRNEGTREDASDISFYNLDTTISVGYPGQQLAGHPVPNPGTTQTLRGRVSLNAVPEW